MSTHNNEVIHVCDLMDQLIEKRKREEKLAYQKYCRNQKLRHFFYDTFIGSVLLQIFDFIFMFAPILLVVAIFCIPVIFWPNPIVFSICIFAGFFTGLSLSLKLYCRYGGIFSSSDSDIAGIIYRIERKTQYL